MSAESGAAATVRLGLGWMGTPDWWTAAGPLFEAGRVDVLEWSFDAEAPATPLDGSQELLAFFASRDALLGHGVSYSVLGADDGARRQAWLTDFACACDLHPLRHVSEHFGFMGAGDFRFASPLPVPMTADTLATGQQHLRSLARAFDGPIGLENLAFAFSAEDVRHEGAFLAGLLAAVDGFLLLDLHNLWCRSENFGTPAHALLETYPLDLVREIHISGGSWATSSAETGRSIRRDTHDDAVPEAVFDLLERALPRCPRLEFVVFERLGGTLQTHDDALRFRADYTRLEGLLKGARDAV